MAKTLKIIKYTILALVALIALYGLAAVLLSLITSQNDRFECEERKTVYVASNGVHLSLILPRDLLDEQIKQGLGDDRMADYYSFGWGDSLFYIRTPEWKDLRPGVAFRALFLPSDGAMHLYYFNNKYPHWKSIELCPAQIALLNEYIHSYFVRDAAGRYLRIPGAAYGPDDAFYDAHGTYHLFFSSNNWVNCALKKAGVRTPVWSPFDKGVLWHLGKE